MSANEFSINISKLREPSQPIRLRDGPSAFERKETTRFCAITEIDEQLKNYQEWGETRTKLFDVLSKITAVVITILSVKMAIAIYFLPAWVPFGIDLPTIILLSLAHGELKERAATYERANQFVPFFKHLLKQHSLSALHPRGEWDLPAVDARLKSDHDMRDSFNKKHPKTAQEIEDVVTHYDLDITPYVQQQVALKFAGHTDVEQKWEAVKTAVKDATLRLREEKIAQFEKSRKEALSLAYSNVYEQLIDLDFAPLPPKEQIKAIVMMYHRFTHLFGELKAVVDKHDMMYAPYAFRPEATQTAKDWKEYLEFAKKRKAEIEPLLALLENKDAQPEEFLLALKEVKEKQLEVYLFNLIDQTRLLKAKVSSWIKAHPLEILAKFEKKVAQLKKKELLDDVVLQEFRHWIKRHPKSSQKQCAHLLDRDSFPKSVALWLEKHPNMSAQTPDLVFDYLLRIRQEMQKVEVELSKLSSLQHTLSDSEKYASFLQALELFGKSLGPLNLLILQEGETSKAKFIFQSAFRNKPSQPFEKVKLSDNPSVRRRNIEEIRLNTLLQKIDSKMVVTNKIRVGGIEIPLLLLLPIEMLFVIYLPSPWIFVTFGLLILLLKGMSYYVEYRINQMDKQKQALKLQKILLDHPDIDAIPGTLPSVQQFKTMQGKYGLDGVGPSWARALTEGESAFAAAPDLKSAKEDLEELGKAASAQAKQFLERRLIILYSKYRSLKAHSPAKEHLRKKILTIQNMLKPKVVDKKAKPIRPQPLISAYQRLTRERNQLEKEWDRVGEEIMALQTRRADYVEQLKNFISLEKKIEQALVKAPIFEEQRGLIEEAKLGEHKRESKELIAPLMDEYAKVIEKIMANGKKEEYMQQGVALFERLKKLPLETLYLEEKKIENTLRQFARLQRRLERLKMDRQYGSKEAMQGQIKEIDQLLPKIREQNSKLKIQYNELTQKIDQARPPAS